MSLSMDDDAQAKNAARLFEAGGAETAVDGTTLRRSLGLVTQVLQRRIPTVLAVTMIDEVRARGGELDLDLLGRILGIPVLGVVGHRGIGLEELGRALERPEGWSRPSIFTR